MIAVFIIGLLACVPVPSFTRARTTSQTNSCVNILLPYLDHNIAPVCPEPTALPPSVPRNGRQPLIVYRGPQTRVLHNFHTPGHTTEPR